MDEKEKRQGAIEYLKGFRKMDENILNVAPKDSRAYVAASICIEYWNLAIKALEQDETASDSLHKKVRELCKDKDFYFACDGESEWSINNAGNNSHLDQLVAYHKMLTDEDAYAGATEYVSRYAVDDKIVKLINALHIGGEWKLETLREYIAKLPKVYLKQKIGRWIYNSDTDMANCSVCGSSCFGDNLGRIETPYCPHCGAKMIEE